MAWNIRGLENPSSDEFLENPDFRQIAAFFLGWAFFYSIQIILSSPLLRENSTRACSFFYSLVTKHIKRQHEPNDIEARTPTLPTTTLRHEENAAKSSTESNYSSPTFQLRVREGDALLVTLALCFACASVAHFASLLRYTPAGGTACVFVVAWGGTAAQAGRLTGLLILSLDLMKLVRRREVCTFWVLLLILLGFVFANNAVATGVLRSVPQLSTSLCYRRHFTPTGLASSLALISAESYLIIRFFFFVSPRGLGWFRKLDTLGDSRVYRAFSLLLLELLTIVSAAKPTNLLVDFVPFAIGTVVVLFAFDLASAKTEKEVALSMWPHRNETQRFTLHPTPARSMTTLSIRRVSDHTTHTISLPNSDFDDPPPAPTRSALSLRVALRNFTAQEQGNSRAVLDKAKTDSPTLPGLVTTQSPRSKSPPVRRFLSARSERSSLRDGHRPQMALVINTNEQVIDIPQSVESPSDSGVRTPDLLRTYTTRKYSNQTRRSSTSSGLVYLTPVSQKNGPSQRPSYLLSPSRSYQQSMAPTPHTSIPTWEETYRQQGLQFDPEGGIPPLPNQSSSIDRQSIPTHTPAVPYAPFLARSSVPAPPGLAKFQPINQPSSLTNTPPMERASGVKGPRPLVTTPRPRDRTLRDGP